MSKNQDKKKSGDCCACHLPDIRRKSNELGRHAPLFKALGDPTRLEIVDLMLRAGGPLCACEIESRFELSQPTISHHLKLLRDAGLLECERRGTWIYYSLAPDGAGALRELARLIEQA